MYRSFHAFQTGQSQKLMMIAHPENKPSFHFYPFHYPLGTNNCQEKALQYQKEYCSGLEAKNWQIML